MAKMHQSINGAILDVEGDERAVSMATHAFHLALAEYELRQVEEKIAAVAHLHTTRCLLKKYIADLKVGRVVNAVATPSAQGATESA